MCLEIRNYITANFCITANKRIIVIFYEPHSPGYLYGVDLIFCIVLTFSRSRLSFGFTI